MTNPIVSSTSRLMWLGIALIVLGVLAIISPFVAGEAVVVVIGLILLIAGLGLGFQGFQATGGFERLVPLILGAIATLAAILVLAHPFFGLSFLTLLLVIFFVADGTWKIIAAFRYISLPGWLWLLGSGALSLLLGMLIWRQWPVSGFWAVGVLMGVNLLSTGVALLALAGSLDEMIRNVLSPSQGTKG